MRPQPLSKSGRSSQCANRHRMRLQSPAWNSKSPLGTLLDGSCTTVKGRQSRSSLLHTPPRIQGPQSPPCARLVLAAPPGGLSVVATRLQPIFFLICSRPSPMPVPAYTLDRRSAVHFPVRRSRRPRRSPTTRSSSFHAASTSHAQAGWMQRRRGRLMRSAPDQGKAPRVCMGALTTLCIFMPNI